MNGRSGPGDDFWGDDHGRGRSGALDGLNLDRIRNSPLWANRGLMVGLYSLVFVSLVLLVVVARPARTAKQLTTQASDTAGLELFERIEQVDSPDLQIDVAGPAPELISVDEDELRRLPSNVRPVDVACENAVEVTAPGENLGQLVADSEPATCFRLAAGEYRFNNVQPKDYMTFIGESRDSVVVRGNDNTENAFSGVATGVSIGRMTFTGFKGSAGESRQEQAPIRGNGGIWLSERGQLASQWLIEDIESSDNFAAGIFLGDHFTVRDSLFANNPVTGMGGDEFVGGLVEGNVVTGNGFLGAEGEKQNNGGMKFTDSGTIDEPLLVRRNEVFENSGIGIWCDQSCFGFNVFDNYVHDEESRAIMYELSSNTIIRGNLLVNTNTWTDFKRDYNAGAITVGESSNALVEDNYIIGAEAGIIARQGERPYQQGEEEKWPNMPRILENVIIRNNVMVNSGAVGLSTGATGKDLPVYDSIRFFDNIYEDPGDGDFWWGPNRYSFSEWQDSGRDAGGSSAIPERPTWPPPPSSTANRTAE